LRNQFADCPPLIYTFIADLRFTELICGLPTSDVHFYCGFAICGTNLRNCPPLIYTSIQTRVKELEERRLAEKKKQLLGTRTGLEAYSTLGAGMGVLETKKNFGANRNKPKRDLFRFCFGLFRETKNNKKVRCFEPVSKQLKQTVSKQTETTLNFLKNTKICSLSNCFGWSPVCFGSIETSKLSVSV
jgi:hypothetical protein